MKLDLGSWASVAAHAKGVAALLLARLRGRRRCEAEALRTPTVTLYGHQLAGNLKAFFDYALDRDDLPFAVQYATIDRGEYAALQETYDRGLVLATRVGGMRRVLASTCLMTSHGPGLFLLLRRLGSQVRFVDVWHGLGFKQQAARDYDSMRHYAALFLSSEHFRKVYREDYGFDDSQLAVTGYARMDSFRDWRETAARVRRELDLPEGRRVILYAPTWRGAGEAGEIPFGLAADALMARLDELAARRDATVLFRLHMNSQFQGAGKGYDHIIDLPQRAYPHTNDLLTAVDVLVTDWSSIACDFGALDRPVVYLDTPEPHTHLKTFDWSDRAGRLAGSLPELLDAIEEGLCGEPDDLQRRRQAMMGLWYGDTLDGRCAERYTNALCALMGLEPPSGAQETST